MYFFYFDESGSRDPSIGTPAEPRDHLYVLLTVGMYERQWRPFDSEISRLKLELAHYLRRDSKGRLRPSGVRNQIQLDSTTCIACPKQSFPGRPGRF